LDASVLLDEISIWCKRHKVPETTFCRLAVNDGKLIARLRLSHHVRAATVVRVRAFMALAQAPARASRQRGRLTCIAKKPRRCRRGKFREERTSWEDARHQQDASPIVAKKKTPLLRGLVFQVRQRRTQSLSPAPDIQRRTSSGVPHFHTTRRRMMTVWPVGNV
jgi:hypothetical protein